MTKQIQVSFQGGGAKLIELLAAVESLQDVSAKKGFEISSVAGTSAGSIAATLVAFNQRVSTIDSSLIEPIINFVKQSPGVQYLKSDTLLNKAEKLADVFFGESLVESDFLLKLIRKMLGSFGIDPDTPIRDVPTPIFITASSMVKRKAIFFCQRDEEHNTTSISEALTASCNIPLIFSGFKEERDWRRACVDGGLCENLPSEPLLAQRDKSGPVLAFCVTSDASMWPPKSAKQYLGHLFDIAINNSVERAKSQIGIENVHTLVSNRTSLDFDQVPAHFRGESNYLRNKKSCEAWLNVRLSTIEKDLSSLSQEIPSVPTLDELMEQNGRALMRRIGMRTFTIEYSAMIAKPYSLQKRIKSKKRADIQRDILTKAHLIPRQKGFDLVEYPIGVSAISEHYVVPTILNVEVVTKSGNRRPVGFDLNLFKWVGEVFGTSRTMKKCIVTLHEPLKSAEQDLLDDEADKLFIWYEQDTECLFKDLEDDNEEYDSLGLQGPRSSGGRIDTVYLAICADYKAAGVEVAADEKSVSLTKLGHVGKLPSELAFLLDSRMPFHCWSANGVTNGTGARLRLSNVKN